MVTMKLERRVIQVSTYKNDIKVQYLYDKTITHEQNRKDTTALFSEKK